MLSMGSLECMKIIERNHLSLTVSSINVNERIKYRENGHLVV